MWAICLFSISIAHWSVEMDENLRAPWKWWLPEAEAMGFDTSAIRERLPSPDWGGVWVYWTPFWGPEGNWIGPEVEPGLIEFLTHKLNPDYPVAVS